MRGIKMEIRMSYESGFYLVLLEDHIMFMSREESEAKEYFRRLGGYYEKEG